MPDTRMSFHYGRQPPPDHPDEVLAKAQAKLASFDATGFDPDRTMTARQRDRLLLDVAAAEEVVAARQARDTEQATMTAHQLAAQVRRY